MKTLLWRGAAAGLAVGALGAAPAVASAAGPATIRCVGTADFCGATVSIAGGASDRRLAVALTDTDLKLVAVRVLPSSSKGAYEISHASYRVGGSVYRFTLNAVQANPKGARIVLLFAAGGRAPVPAGA